MSRNFAAPFAASGRAYMTDASPALSARHEQATSARWGDIASGLHQRRESDQSRSSRSGGTGSAPVSPLLPAVGAARGGASFTHQLPLRLRVDSAARATPDGNVVGTSSELRMRTATPREEGDGGQDDSATLPPRSSQVSRIGSDGQPASLSGSIARSHASRRAPNRELLFEASRLLVDDLASAVEEKEATEKAKQAACAAAAATTASATAPHDLANTAVDAARSSGSLQARLQASMVVWQVAEDAATLDDVTTPGFRGLTVDNPLRRGSFATTPDARLASQRRRMVIVQPRLLSRLLVAPAPRAPVPPPPRPRKQSPSFIPRNPDHVRRHVGTTWSAAGDASGTLAMNRRAEQLGLVADDVLTRRMSGTYSQVTNRSH